MASTTHLTYQLRATRALVKFILDHKGEVDGDLSACLGALERKDVATAVRHAQNVKVVGMGSITDWIPPVVFPHETSEYLFTELEALAHNWWRLIALSLEVRSET
jgi:hypothetical protein